VKESSEKHPLVSFIYLLLIVLAGVVVFAAAALILVINMYGLEELANGLGRNDMAFLKSMQILSSILIFIVPAIVFARMESGNISSFFDLDRKISWKLILLSVIIMLSSMPLIEWTVAMNKQMVLPDFLRGIQEWMRIKEEQAAQITKMLLAMTSSSDLLVNLLMIAVLPAVGEELIFRGCLQNIFTRWTKNYHWGIWIAAIIFSTIHVQFFGFIPRMLLGALFGYFYVWGRSLWLPILAHLINNGAAVITAYVYQLRGESLDKLEETTPISWPVYLTSVVITMVLLGYMYNEWKRTEPVKPDQL
jgi:membrane protease YdiL (CAAX protease family)